MSQPNPNIPTQPEASDNLRQSDEIDFLRLFQSILKTWKIWALSLIVVSLIFGAIQSLKLLIQEPPETIYSKPIRLTFPNSHKQLYPSGAKFVHSDIVAPAVVQQAFERNNLASFGLDIADLQGGLSTTPYSPTYPLIIKRYEKIMEDKKLTRDQISELEKQLTKELEQATTGEILISWRIEEQSIPKSIAEKILNDIPAIWAEQTIKEKGVLQINAQLATTNSLNANLILNEEILIAGDILVEKLALLRRNIGELSSFKGSQTITDPQTGMRLTDLNNSIDDLNKHALRNITAPIRLQGLSNTPEISNYYYQDKLNNLKHRYTTLQTQALAIKESLSSYNNYNHSGSVMNNETSNAPTVMTQLSSDMLDRLVRLSSDADREKYKQKLNAQWLKLTKEIAETASKITETELVLKAIEKRGLQPAKLTAAEMQYLTHAKAKLPEILQQLTDYFAVSERIIKQLRSETTGIKEHLYIPVTDTILENEAVFDIKGAIIAWIALMFLTSILVIPGCMIRDALKARNQ